MSIKSDIRDAIERAIIRTLECADVVPEHITVRLPRRVTQRTLADAARQNGVRVHKYDGPTHTAIIVVR